MEDRGFIQSQINPFLFTRGSLAIVLYADNNIIIAKYLSFITNLLRSLKNSLEIGIVKIIGKYKKFSFIGNELIKTFLDAQVEKRPYKYYLSQTYLISLILEIVNLKVSASNSRNTKDTPAIKLLLIKDTNRDPQELN